jgi:hypothetical protein
MNRPFKILEQSTLLWNNLKRKVTVPSTRLTLRGGETKPGTQEIIINTNSPRADDEFGEGILGNQKFKKMYYLNVSESGIDSR